MFTRKDLLRGAQLVHAEMKRRAVEQSCACNDKQKTMNDLIRTDIYGGRSPQDTPIAIQEGPTLDFNHKLIATANDAILIICGNLSLTIATFDFLKAGTPTAVIYSLEDSNRLVGDMRVLNSRIEAMRFIPKECVKVSIDTSLTSFADKKFETYRFQGTQLVLDSSFYLRNKLPDKQNPKIAEFPLPVDLDSDIALVVRALGGVTAETVNTSLTIGHPKTLWPEKCNG